MERREFFRRGLRKATKTAVKAADAHVARRASRWIRPPYALDELEFLLACTRCGKCIEACPHGMIFSLKSTAVQQPFLALFAPDTTKSCPVLPVIALDAKKEKYVDADNLKAPRVVRSLSGNIAKMESPFS